MLTKLLKSLCIVLVFELITAHIHCYRHNLVQSGEFSHSVENIYIHFRLLLVLFNKHRFFLNTWKKIYHLKCVFIQQAAYNMINATFSRYLLFIRISYQFVH